MIQIKKKERNETLGLLLSQMKERSFSCLSLTDFVYFWSLPENVDSNKNVLCGNIIRVLIKFNWNPTRNRMYDDGRYW